MHDFSYNHFVGTRSIVLQVASIKPFVNDTGCLFGAAGKYANFYHFDDRCEADTALDLLCNAAAQVCEVHITSGFYIDSHGVLAVQMRDANLVLAGISGAPCLTNVVMTISPISPSGRFSPVTGSMISR